MNNRKYLLGLLLGVFSIILIYNFFLIQYFGNNSMNMGMNRSPWNSPVFFVDIQCLIIVGMLMIALLLFEIIRSRSDKNECRQCGKKIENSRWKVCPVCGTVINVKAGV